MMSQYTSYDSAEIVEIIHKILDDEATTLGLLAPDPEAQDPDKQWAVEVYAAWTEWTAKRFYGKNLLEALRSARDAENTLNAEAEDAELQSDEGQG